MGQNIVLSIEISNHTIVLVMAPEIVPAIAQLHIQYYMYWYFEQSIEQVINIITDFCLTYFIRWKI